MHLYLLGGHQKTRWIRPVRAEHRFDLALIVRVDTESACCERIVEYVTPNDAKPQPESSSLFTSASLCGNKLYACTYSEVLVFEVPFFRRIDYISSLSSILSTTSPRPRTARCWSPILGSIW